MESDGLESDVLSHSKYFVEKGITKEKSNVDKKAVVKKAK